MNFKALIIDDDKNFIETLKDTLKEKDLNIEIKITSSAKEAFDVLSSFTPDLIILDIQLPDMHGIDFLKTIKTTKSLSNAPVILISAKYTEPADRTNALINGAKAFFSKPVDIDKLWEEMLYQYKKINKI